MIEARMSGLDRNHLDNMRLLRMRHILQGKGISQSFLCEGLK